MSKERIRWIDQIKGFAIICMVISHAIPGYDVALKNWITAFNMPLFFFVSGILEGNKNYRVTDLPSYLKRRFFSLGIPYIVFCMLYSFFDCGLSFISGDSLSSIIQQMSVHIRSTVCMFGIQSMWFLPVFFFASLLDAFVMKRVHNKYITFMLSVLFCMILLIADRRVELNMWMRFFGKIFGAEVFIMWGRLLKSMLEKVRVEFSLIGLLLFSNLALMNGFVSVNFDYGNYPVLFFINAVAMTFFLCGVFNKIGHRITENINRLLCEFGMNTIVILVTNNLIIETLRLLDHKLFSSFCLKHGLFGCLLFAFLVLMLEYPVIKLSKGKLGVLFGKRRISV